MLFALALLLLQPQDPSQVTLSAENVPPVLSVSSSSPAATESFMEISLPLTPDASDISIQPSPISEDAVLASVSSTPEPDPINAPAVNAFLRPATPMTVSVKQLLAEERHKQHIWIGLGIAEHSAATFDAWSTRRAMTMYGAQELNPMLKPFAGNASLYAAIQVGPAVMDFVGKKMMSSKYSWVRRMWWVPQSASFASSLFCGVHNLGVR
jgi:hypothetical protein